LLKGGSFVPVIIRFAIICSVAALLNAVAIVTMYLSFNQRFSEFDIVAKSYLNGGVIALGFYFLFFFLPNYRAHLHLSKFDYENYTSALQQRRADKKLYQMILSHWFLHKWRADKKRWVE
jgi:hypothetical protein